jgi:aminopeptidase N
VKATGSYDAAAKRYTLTLEQSCGPSPGQPTKEPYHIPVRVGLLGRASGGELCPERVLELREASQVVLWIQICSHGGF